MYEQETEEINALKKYLLSHIPSTPLPPNNLLLSPKSIALKAAVAGLDKELGRLEREERLVRKFTNENTVYGSGSRAGISSARVHTKNEDDDVAMEYVKMTKEDAAADGEGGNVAAERENDDEDDWEEAKADLSKKKPSLTDSQDFHHEIAQKWSSATISRIAKTDVRVDTPIGALGLALHAALVELTASGSKKTEQMFRCTGVPDNAIISQFLGEDKKTAGGGGGGGGFAPPIRELPKGVLMPSKWEDTAKQQDAQLIAFRYKCGQDVYTTSSGPTNDSTTLYLVLHQFDSSSVRVCFGPMPAMTKGSKTTNSNQFQLPLTQHINLDGFQASKSKSSSAVQPSLFFISLPELLLQFGSAFGLLSVMQLSFGEGTDAMAEVGLDTVTDASVSMKDISSDMLVGHPAVTSATKVDFRPDIPPDGPAVDVDPLRVMDSHTGMRRRGDFEGDLLPGGIHPGIPAGPAPPSFGGSQVGPNHPMFDRSFGEDDDLYNGQGSFGGSYGPPSFGIPGVGGSGGSMRPRFDPYGPPGGPTEPGRGGRGGRGRFGSGRGRGGRGRMPPGGFGDPNNDHMQPPNSDYFS